MLSRLNYRPTIMWIPETKEVARPIHIGLARAIERAIADGTLSIGDRLSAQREFAFQLGVTVATVNKAFALLTTAGSIVTRVGRGSYVGAFPEDLHETTTLRMADFRDNSSLVAPLNDFMNRAFGSIARRKSLSALLEYHDLGTIKSHRRAAAQWLLKRGLVVPDDWIIVSEDGRNALISLLMAVSQTGKDVMCGPYGPEGLRSALSFHGVKPHTSALLPTSITQEGLEQLDNIGALWCAPTGDEPTNAVMPSEQRSLLTGWARANDCIIIEDDTAGHLSGDALPTLFSLAPEQTVYMTGMLKSLTPGLPICIIVMSPSLQETFSSAIEASNWRSPMLAGEIFATLVADGTADRLLNSHRLSARERLAIARSIRPLAPYVPDIGSNHLWISLPAHCNDQELADALRVEGLIVMPSSAFALGKHGAPALRVSLTAIRSLDYLRESLGRLAKLLPS